MGTGQRASVSQTMMKLMMVTHHPRAVWFGSCCVHQMLVVAQCLLVNGTGWVMGQIQQHMAKSQLPTYYDGTHVAESPGHNTLTSELPPTFSIRLAWFRIPLRLMTLNLLF